jgi:hypothetical protein
LALNTTLLETHLDEYDSFPGYAFDLETAWIVMVSFVDKTFHCFGFFADELCSLTLPGYDLLQGV